MEFVGIQLNKKNTQHGDRQPVERSVVYIGIDLVHLSLKVDRVLREVRQDLEGCQTVLFDSGDADLRDAQVVLSRDVTDEATTREATNVSFTRRPRQRLRPYLMNA